MTTHNAQERDAGPAPEPIWKGMTPEEQRAYIRDLCRIENERARANQNERLRPVRPVYTGSYPDGR